MNTGVLLRLRSKEDGNALVLVIGSMLVLASMALTTLAFTIQSQGFARYTQDYSASMVAAQSGIEDLITRLNRADAYGDSIDCDNPAQQRPMTTPNPCGWNASTPVGWVSVVPGETDPDAPHYHYEVDGSLSLYEGTVKVVATGRVNGEYRTIEAAVGKGGSTDFVYYTDFEVADPANKLFYPNGPSNDACGRNGYSNARYWWENNGTARRSQGCTEITFVSADRLDGAVHTNDSALSSGAHFLAGFQTANVYCQNATASTSTWNQCLRNTGGASSTGNFHGIRPQYAEPLYLDDTSAAFVDFPGCHYYGNTRIQFHSNGTMTVWNKQVNNGNTAPRIVPGPEGQVPACGNLTALNSTAGWTGPVPDQMVIEVSAAPAAAGRQMCNAGEIGGPTGRTLPLGTYDRNVNRSTGTSQPSYTYDQTMRSPEKFCQEGNLYVEGVLDGRVSLAAQQSIIVTGDVVLAGGRNGDDILGLIATNTIEIIRPLVFTYQWVQRRPNCATSGSGAQTYQWCTTSSTGTVQSDWPFRYNDPQTGTRNPTTGVQVAGSIQTLQHSFLVQNYNLGGQSGVLNVFGSIAQRWRGAVGATVSGSFHGYDKLYQYDRRLIYGPPPYFPRWTNAKWSLRYSGEVVTPSVVKGP